MNSKKSNTYTDPEEFFGVPDYVEVLDIAKRMRQTRALIDTLRGKAAVAIVPQTAASNSACC